MLAAAAQAWHNAGMDARKPRDPEREREEDDRRFTTSLAGLAVALFLVLIGFYVIEKLANESRLEDCALQGRTNCVNIDLTPQR